MGRGRGGASFFEAEAEAAEEPEGELGGGTVSVLVTWLAGFEQPADSAAMQKAEREAVKSKRFMNLLRNMNNPTDDTATRRENLSRSKSSRAVEHLMG